MASSPVPASSAVTGAGMLRFIALFSVVALGMLGALAVFGALSIDEFTDFAARLAMLTGIAIMMAIAVWALLKRR